MLRSVSWIRIVISDHLAGTLIDRRTTLIGANFSGPYACVVLPARLVLVHQLKQLYAFPVPREQLRPSTHRDMVLNDGLGLIVVIAHFGKEGRGFFVVMPYFHRSKKRKLPLWTEIPI